MSRVKWVQVSSTIAWIVLFGGWQTLRAFTPDPTDAQAISDIINHPFASGIGTLIPTIVLSPFIYWISGRAWRRIHEPKG
jgi:hypothetical protein